MSNTIKIFIDRLVLGNFHPSRNWPSSHRWTVTILAGHCTNTIPYRSGKVVVMQFKFSVRFVSRRVNVAKVIAITRDRTSSWRTRLATTSNHWIMLFIRTLWLALYTVIRITKGESHTTSGSVITCTMKWMLSIWMTPRSRVWSLGSDWISDSWNWIASSVPVCAHVGWNQRHVVTDSSQHKKCLKTKANMEPPTGTTYFDVTAWYVYGYWIPAIFCSSSSAITDIYN